MQLGQSKKSKGYVLLIHSYISHIWLSLLYVTFRAISSHVKAAMLSYEEASYGEQIAYNVTPPRVWGGVTEEVEQLC